MTEDKKPLTSDICHLTSGGPPSWVADYIGIPFVERGRDRAGCDCWGLVRLMLAERFGLELPSYADGYDSLEDCAAIAQLIGNARDEGLWRRIDAQEAKAGDLAVLRGVPVPHIGVIVAPGVMLHTMRGAEASLARLGDQAWRHRLEATRREPYAGFYRYQMSDARCQNTNRTLISDLCPLSSEVLAPGEGEVEVVVCPHPFWVERRIVRVPAGLSLEEIFTELQPDPLLRIHAAASIGDLRIAPREVWRRVRPKPGARVTIRALPPVPRGGDSKVLRTVLMVAVIAAAIAAPYIIPGLVPGTLTAGLVSAGIAIGGSLLVNALLPLQQRRLDNSSGRDSPTFSIEGAQNVLRPYEPIPRPLGQHRFVGHLGARTYRQILNGEVYFRILLIWGSGPLEVADIKIGETPIEAYDDVEIETRQGFLTDEPLTLFTNDVFEEVPGVTLTAAAGFVTRRSQADAEEIDLDFTFPKGLVGFDDDDGDKESRQVNLMIQYAPAGSDAWSSDELGTAIAGGSIDLGPGPKGRHAPFWQQGKEDRQRPYKNRTDAVVIDRLTGAVSVIEGRVSKVVFDGRFGELRSYEPQIPAGKASIAWIYRSGDNWTTVEAGRITDRRSSPDAVTGSLSHPGPPRRPARVAFSTSDVLPGSNRIRQTTGAFRNGEILRLGSSGTLPGGLPSGTNVYVVNRSDASYQLSLTDGGEPIDIADTGSGEHYASSLLADPATDFAVTARSPASTLVDYTGGTLVYQGMFVRAATTSAYRVGLNIKLPSKGQYDVRVKRRTPDSGDELTSDEVVWTGLRTITYRDPFTLPGVARTAILIRATEQLEGRVEPISAVLTSLAKVWDGTARAWVDDQPTRNPAALFRLVAQDQANRAARSDAQLDLPAIEAWHEVCEAEGWAFNMVVDFRTTVPEMLAMIAAAGMAGPTIVDGKLSVIQDVDKTVPVQHITPRNSFGYQGRVAYPQVPHGFRVRFIDETSGYKNNERIVTDDGYGETNARKLVGIEFPGVTDPELIWRHARRRIAEARLRPETHRVSVDIEGLVATRGDLVRFSHDAVKIGLGTGRLKAVALGGGGEATGVTLDAAVPMEAGTSYVIRIRDETGASVLAAVDTVAGEQTVLAFATPIAAPTIKAGDVFMFGELGLESKELIVTGIEPDDDLGFTLTMVDLARDLFKADDLAVAFTAGDVDADADTIGPAGHGFFDGDRVAFSTDGTLPAVAPFGDGPGNLIENRAYFVVNRTDDDYQIAETAGGSPLDLVDGGSGNHTATRQIPPFDAQISQDPVLPERAKPAAPVIEDLRSDESVMIRDADGGLRARVLVAFSIPATTTEPDAVEVQIRRTGAGDPWRRVVASLLPLDEIVVDQVETGDVYDLRLRSITRAGIPSDWTARLAYEVEGTTAPPPDVEALYVDDDVARWEMSDPPLDLAGFDLRWHEGVNRTWSTAEPLFDGLTTGSEVSVAQLSAGVKTLLIKAVDVNGTESVNAAVAVLDIVFPVSSKWEIGRTDLKALGFPGTIVNGTVEGTGPGTTLDRAGGTHGTLVGGPTWVRGLKGNSALLFDGADRYVSMGDVHDFIQDAPFTITCRFRARIPTTLGDNVHYILVNKRDVGGNNGYTLWISGNPAASGQLRAIRHGGGSSTQLVGPVLEDQREYVAAMVYDGNAFRLVLDGATVAGPTASPQSIVDHAGDFRIGKDSNVGGFRFDGIIDEVQVWNVARSDADIAADTAGLLEGTALSDAIAAGLVGYWPFEEGTINGDLVGLPTQRTWIPGRDDVPTWGPDDFAPGWPTVYDTLTYSTDYDVPETLVPSDLDRLTAGIGHDRKGVRFRLAAPDGQPGWPELLDSAPGWRVTTAPGGFVVGLDAAPSWFREQDRIFWPWRLRDVRRESLYLEIKIWSGEVEPRVPEMALRHVGHVAEDSLEDVAIAATGTRLNFATAFRRFLTLFLTLQDDGGDAVALRVLDKDPRLGPLVVALDASGAQTTATIDATAKGLL